MDFATAMKLGSIMGSVLGEATQNKYLKAASQAFAGFSTAASGVAGMQAGTANAANKTTPSGTPVQPGKHPVAPPPPVKPDLAPQTPFKPDMQGMTGAQKQQLTKAVNQQNTWLGQQQAPKAELLKVKPGGYTKPGLQEAYLKGLEQSGAKLDNKGQIVKQSGQAFKTKGWDRKAQLMGGRRTPDRLHKLRMLAIDRANIGAKDVKPPTNVMKPEVTQTSRQGDYERHSPSKEYLKTDKGEGSSNWDPSGITDEEMRKKYYQHENGNWYEKGYDPGVTPLW